MKKLYEHSVELPLQFKKGQEVGHQDLNRILNFIEFASTGCTAFARSSVAPGIVTGFDINFEHGNDRMKMTVSSGIAIDAAGKKLILPEGVELTFPESVGPENILVISADAEPGLTDELKSNTFRVNFIIVMLVSQKELDEKKDLVEIGRFSLEESSNQNEECLLRHPVDILRPGKNELDLRNVNWLDPNGDAFLRPELQKALAESFSSLQRSRRLADVSEAAINEIGVAKHFCQCGLFSRLQFIDLLSTLDEFKSKHPANFVDFANVELLEILFNVLFTTPVEVWLNQDNPYEWLEYRNIQSMKIHLGHDDNLVAFDLSFKRQNDHNSEWFLSDYKNDLRTSGLFHVWDEKASTKNEISYQLNSVPHCLDLYAQAEGNGQPGVRHHIFRCTFSEEGDRLKVELHPISIEYWPSAIQERVRIYKTD